MTDERAIDWIYFLPNPISFEVQSGPEWLSNQLECHHVDGAQHSAVITWQASPADIPPLDKHSALVAIRPRGLSPTLLEAAGFQDIRRFAVIPSLENARWFVPLASPAVAAGTFSLYAPHRRSARIKRTAIQLAARVDLPGWYKDEIWIAQRERGPLHTLSTQVVASQPSHFAISTGTPGPTRKPTLTVLDERGVPRAVMKIADHPITRSLIQHEAEVLHALAGSSVGSTRVPESLGETEIGDRLVTMQSVLPGRTASPRFGESHAYFLSLLQSSHHRSARATSLMRSLPARIDGVREPTLNLREVSNEIVRCLGNAQLPRIVVHGDFAPWNLRRHCGEIAAFDWEFAEMDGLPLFDVLHFRIQSGILLDNWTDHDALAMMHTQRMDRSQGMTEDQMRGLQLAYWLNTLLQRHELGHHQSDDRIQRAKRILCMLMNSNTGVIR